VKRIFAAFLLVITLPMRAEVIDRIAAIVDGRVITLSEIERVAQLELVDLSKDESPVQYRKRVMQALIDDILRRKDVERLGVRDVSDGEISQRINRLQSHWPSAEAFGQRLADVGLTDAELRSLVKTRLELEGYIDERFAPLIFVSLDEIERYYASNWSEQRRAQGLDVPPLAEVRDEIRDLIREERLRREVDRWTEQLRARANIDIYVYR
jgi:peptidyl-prolyl cis-trans isomerase SurA